MPEQTSQDIQKDINSVFGSISSMSGEEELLRIASKFSLQLSSLQIQALEALNQLAFYCSNPKTRESLISFVDKYVEYKAHNNSDMFVMRALDSISLRKFIGVNSFNVKLDR